MVVLSYIHSNSTAFVLDNIAFDKFNIHVYFLRGVTLKNGPSGSMLIATAMCSSFKHLKVWNEVVRTGEITLFV